MRNDRNFLRVSAATILPCVFLAVLLAGCARRYDIILTDGSRVSNVTKPVLDRESGVFSYKDVRGDVHQKNAARVVEIAPHTKKLQPQGLQ